MGNVMMKDFFGTPALDYGSYSDLKRKYRDKIFIFVTNAPLPLDDNGYVLEIGNPDDREAMRQRADAYYDKMRAAGHLMCGTGIARGWDLVEEALDVFVKDVGV